MNTEPEEEETDFRPDLEVFLEVRIRDTVYSNRGLSTAPQHVEQYIVSHLITKVAHEITDAIEKDYK